MIEIPKEIASYFDISNFTDYPVISIPQSFVDDRGEITNVADGILGDVAVIKTNAGATRANHYHKEDWHLCYLIDGAMEYYWSAEVGSSDVKRIQVESGSLIFTPKLTPHKITFQEKSTFISISRLSRVSENYESDTVRLEEKSLKF